MKIKRNTIYLIVILLLLLINIFQVIDKMQNANQRNLVGLEYLEKLTSRIEFLIKMYQEDNPEHIFSVEDIDRLNKLTEYCIKEDNNDSLKVFVRLVNSQFVEAGYVDQINVKQLKQLNKKERAYAFKFIEYLALNSKYFHINNFSSKYDSSVLAIISNASFKNNKLKQGEDYEAAILLIPYNSSRPGSVIIEGDTNVYKSDEGLLRYVRPSTKKGENEFKGIYKHENKGKKHSFEFKVKYIVE